MKKILALLLGFIIIIGSYGVLKAQDKKIVAVIPFTVYSAENIDYIRQGVSGILSSRLAASDKIEVTNREAIAEALKALGVREPSGADVESVGKALKVHYVVWGSLTKIGSSVSIDAKLSEITTAKPPVNFFSQTQNLDEIIPRTSEVAERIARQVTGTQQLAGQQIEPQARPSGSATLPVPPPPAGSSREAEIISSLRGGGKKATFTSIINPDFINVPGSTGLDRRGFWMSNDFPNEFKGMDIGDVTGDGMNDVVMIDSTNIFIYQKKGQEFKQIHHIRGKSYDNYLSVDVADINRNGIKEIIVTNINETLLNSFVLEFRDGKFTQIASDIRLFLRVISPDGKEPVLLGQNFGSDAIFNSPIHEVVWRNGQYQPGKRMKIPQGLPIYGLTIDSLAAGGEKIIVLNDFDNITLYHPTDKPLSRLAVFGGAKELIYRSEEPFGGSNNYLAPTSSSRNPVIDQVNNTYLNLRILTYDLEGKGKRVIIIPKNSSPIGRVLSNVKLFTSSELYCLSWDGLGMAENWRSRKINGYVADYQIKDLNNDGKDEIVMILVREHGTGRKGHSVLVSYDLTVN